MQFLWKSMHPHKAPVSLEWTRHQKTAARGIRRANECRGIFSCETGA